MLVGLCHGSFQGATLFGKHHFTLLDSGYPQNAHGIGYGGREIGAKGIYLRAFTFPQF